LAKQLFVFLLVLGFLETHRVRSTLLTPGASPESSNHMIQRYARFLILAFTATLFLSACGKATVKPMAVNEGFALSSLQSGINAVIVDTEVGFIDLTPSYQNAFSKQFGSTDSLSSYLAARLIDSLNAGAPKLHAVAAPALNPRHILHIRNLVLERGTRELPTALLPSGSGQSMQAAGGGTSEGWTIAFEVDVWRPTGVLWSSDTGGELSDIGGALSVPDSASGLMEYSFTVNGQADVPLYAYKTALVEAVNAAVTKTARHLRGQ
jgi:hypothetical protein